MNIYQGQLPLTACIAIPQHSDEVNVDCNHEPIQHELDNIYEF